MIDMVNEKIDNKNEYIINQITKENEQLRAALDELRENVQSFEKLCNLRGWAIDRAISIFQTDRNGPAPTFEQINELAEKLALYSYGEDLLKMKESAAKLGETIQ